MGPLDKSFPGSFGTCCQKSPTRNEKKKKKDGRPIALMAEEFCHLSIIPQSIRSTEYRVFESFRG